MVLYYSIMLNSSSFTVNVTNIFIHLKTRFENNKGG